MSWPMDGGPRFVVVEHGGALGPTSHAKSLQNITVAILDRAFCHSEIAKFRSEDSYGGIISCAQGRALARAAAQTKLAALNATHDEAVAAADQKVAA